MQTRDRSIRSFKSILTAAILTLGIACPAAAEGWQAGTARVAITPRAADVDGRATRSRTKPSEGAVHDLWAKALVLEDPAGREAVLVTLDVCGIDRELSNGDPRRAPGRATAWRASGSCWPARTRTAGRSSARTC